MKDANQSMNEMYAACLLSIANHGSVTCKQQQPMPKAMQSIWIIGSFEVSNSGVLVPVAVKWKVRLVDAGDKLHHYYIHILKAIILYNTSMYFLMPHMTQSLKLSFCNARHGLRKVVGEVCQLLYHFFYFPPFLLFHWPEIPKMKWRTTWNKWVILRRENCIPSLDVRNLYSRKQGHMEIAFFQWSKSTMH